MSVTPQFDVAVIGAGDIGAAIARELARFELAIVLIDKGDVGGGTSNANTAILHSGFDCRPGTLQARLVARGHDLLLEYADAVGIPVQRTGALMVAWNQAELERLEEIQASAAACGYEHARPIDIDELRRREPALADGALGALEIPDESIICPWTPALAHATQAVLAGVQLRRGIAVTGLERMVGVGAIPDSEGREAATGWRIGLADGSQLSAGWLVNAAGLHCDDIHRRAGRDGFSVTPRRGEMIVFDKLARPLVHHIILPVPSDHGRGAVIAPTVFGNVMVGPIAGDIADRTANATTTDGLARLREDARHLMPLLLEHEVTDAHAGLWAATEHGDYVLEADGGDRYACAGGSRCTGLTAAMAIAEWIRDALDGAGLPLRERKQGLAQLTMPNIGEASPRPYMRPEVVELDPAYGEVVCFCERVTRGELEDALRSPIPPIDVDGLRRRTRALTGRCQGSFCAAQITRLLSEEVTQ